MRGWIGMSLLVIEASLLLPALLVGALFSLLLMVGFTWSIVSKEPFGFTASDLVLASHPLSLAASLALFCLVSCAIRDGAEALREMHPLWWLAASLVVPIVGLMLLDMSFLPPPPQGQGDPRRLLFLQGSADVPCLVPLAHLLVLSLWRGGRRGAPSRPAQVRYSERVTWDSRGGGGS